MFKISFSTSKIQSFPFSALNRLLQEKRLLKVVEGPMVQGFAHYPWLGEKSLHKLFTWLINVVTIFQVTQPSLSCYKVVPCFIFGKGKLYWVFYTCETIRGKVLEKYNYKKITVNFAHCFHYIKRNLLVLRVHSEQTNTFSSFDWYYLSVVNHIPC